MTEHGGDPADVGLVLLRSPEGIDPFYGDLIAGLEDVLHPRGMRVLLRSVPTSADVTGAYRHWIESGLVAGIVVSDLTPDDARPAMLSALGMPHVTLGGLLTLPDDAVVRIDNDAAMHRAVEHLASLGHRVVGRVSGPVRYLHTQARDRAFLAGLAAIGGSGRIVVGDYSAASGVSGTLALLGHRQRPSAIIYDNDVMAVAGLDAARAAGLAVPRDLSILAWDDSTRCRLATPALSAMSHDVRGLGVLAGEVLLRLLDAGPVEDVTAPTPVLVDRGSTAPPSSPLPTPAPPPPGR